MDLERRLHLLEVVRLKPCTVLSRPTDCRFSTIIGKRSGIYECTSISSMSSYDIYNDMFISNKKHPTHIKSSVMV